MHIEDACGTVEKVRVIEGGAEIVVQLRQTPKGRFVYELLRAQAQEIPPRSSGLAFTTFALGRTNQDGVADVAVPVGIYLVQAKHFAEVAT